MSAPVPQTSPKSAPKPASWAYAENYHPETEAALAAREQGERFGAQPIGRGTAATLTVLARAVGARAVVEIGTGAGVSGLALFAGMQPDGILTSVDVEPEHQQAARKTFLGVGIPTQRFRLIGGAALSVLPKLSDGAYDLVFVDADKSEYPDYIDQAVRLLRHGGIIAIDNALWHDKTADASNTEAETESVRAAVTAIRDNEDLLSTLLPVGDGLLVAVKR